MKIGNQQKEIVIESLEFARLKLLKSEFIDRAELHNHLLSKGFLNPDSEDRRYLIDALYGQIFSISHPTQQFKYSKHIMGFESYLGLLSHEELEQARKDSAEARLEARTALRWTKWALWVATLVGLAQIFVAFVGPD